MTFWTRVRRRFSAYLIMAAAAATVVGYFFGPFSFDWKLRVPVYELVTDASICGMEMTDRKVHEYSACENKNKDPERYKKSEVFEGKSGFAQSSASHSRPGWCAQMKARKQAEVTGSFPIHWTNEVTSEESQNQYGRVTYEYYCKATAHWDPVYVVERWSGCGPAPMEKIEVPKSCQKQVGTRWFFQKPNGGR